MTVLGDIVRLPRGSSLTHIVHDGKAPLFGAEVASVHVIALPDDQHASVELGFLDAHMPFSLGGLAGVLPDGRPWAVLVQHAPMNASARAGRPDPWWVLRDSLDRALRFNHGAHEIAGATFVREQLLESYRAAGVPRRRVMAWSVPDLLRGLMAEACGAPLDVVADGHEHGCALPGFEHACTGDVFTDVFAAKRDRTMPVTGQGLWLDEPAEAGAEAPAARDLRRLRRDTLVPLARSYRVPTPKKKSRRELIRAIRKAAVFERRTGVRRPRGDERTVGFKQFDTFVGVDPSRLIPRLRLDPESSPVDYRGETVIVTIEDESYALSAGDVCGDEPVEHLIDAWAADSSWAGFAEQYGIWVRSYLSDDDDHLVATPLGDDERELALDWLGDLVLDNEFDPQVRVEIDCAYLDDDDPDDRIAVLGIVGGRFPVALNGMLLGD